MGTKKKSQGIGPKHVPIPDPKVEDDLDCNQLGHEEMDYTQFSHINTDGFEDEKFNTDQQEEYVLIASMYPASTDRFERIAGKRDPWKGFDNLAYAFNVTSFTNRDFKARLEIEYPQAYPKVALKAKLVDLKPRQDQGLEKAINNALEEIPGQRSTTRPNNQFEGVPTLVETIIDHLDSAAKSFEAAQHGKSLLEVRQQEEALQRDHKQAEWERAIARREAEALKREEQLKDALRLEKLRRHDPNAPELQQEQDPNAEEIVADIPVRFNSPITIIDETTNEALVFKAVFGSFAMLERVDKKVHIVHPVKFGKMKSFRFVLKQIYIPDSVASKQELENAMDEVRRTLEDCKTNEHPNVIKIYAYQIDHDIEDPEMCEWKISVLSEYSPIGCVYQSLEVSNVFHAGKVRLYAGQILQALDFIEKLGHIHPAVHSSNLLLFRDLKGEMLVKLSDGYGSKLKELVKKAQDPSGPAPSNVVGWTAPELSNQSLEINGKTCIWEFGVILVQMAFIEGFAVEHILTSPERLIWRDDLDESFLHVLRNCFSPVPRLRSSPFDLISYDFFKDGDKFINIPTPENPGMEPHLLRSGIAGNLGSTWDTKWQKAGRLGAGGFGQVIKARNVDDGQWYAVKRLLCKTPKDLSDIWAEVKLLAQLNHPGVVRYYNAWNEEERHEDDYITQHRGQTEKLARSVRSRPAPETDPFSTGHDFMDPSLHRNIGPEYDSDDNDDDDNLFGYQSPPSDSEEENDGAEHTEDQTNDEDEDESLNELLRPPSMPQFDNDEEAIEFENDLDSNELVTPSEPAETNSISPSRSRRRSSTPRVSILYIQMELCETATLSTMIKAGLPYRMSQVWRLFSQILQALDHIHSCGVVHRDLKPANIFIDSTNNIKIGDFGLAVTGQNVRNENDWNTATPARAAGPDSWGVGTMYYTAPELERGGSGIYSSKADMYSLGVIFFQMCFPMTTETEKVSNLRRIGQDKNFEMPPYFEQEGYLSQAKIIRKLISHNQKERPTAKELLEGGYLPETIDHATIQRYLTKLAEEEPEELQELVEKYTISRMAKFTRAQELAYFSRGRKSRNSGLGKHVSEIVNDKIKDIFHRHGAVSSDRVDQLPARDFYRLAAVSLEDTGTLVQLPFDLTLPFAAMLAEEPPEFPKNYSFGTVYRRERRGIQPKKIAEIDYDHVSYSAKGLSIKDAQVIKVLDEVITEIPSLAERTFIIYINHGDLLALILEFCRVPAKARDFVIEELSYLHVRGAGWKDLRAKLLNPKMGVPERVVSALAKFHLNGSFDSVRETIDSLFDDEFRGRAARPLSRLEEIIQCTAKLRVKSPVHFSPLSNQSEPLYQGSIMFHCVELKSAKVFAVGGRYDKLIEHYKQPEDPPGVTRAVGFRINTIVLNIWSKSFYERALSGKSKARAKDTSFITPRLDVIITSFDEKTLEGPCLDILQSLLDCGVKAEISEHFASMEQLDAAYGEPLNYWLVIVRPGASTKRQIKLRSPDREEKEVRPTELVAVIKSELESKSTTQLPEVRHKRTMGSHGELGNTLPIVLSRKHKGKKANRMNISDAVSSAAKELADEISTSAPVIAIAPDSDTVLQALRNTRLVDSESWKTFRQTLPLDERAYFQDLQAKLEEMAEEGKEGVFIVNYLTTSSIYYDLGKKI